MERYECSFNGAEVCNGLDDDCDGTVDEGLVPPSNFCNPNGVCMGTSATCGGALGWRCSYPGSYEPGGETRCDGLDNDCDGLADEPFPSVGTSCGNGSGECRTIGVVECNAAGDGTRCTAPPPLVPSPEACDDRDNDCDGLIDEEIDPSNIPTVTMPRPGGGVFDMFVYEASRPDGTDASAGSVSTVACSRGDVMPWTDVTWAEANAACCSLNAGGACLGGTGWRLCDAPDWEAGCEGPSATCDWAYAASCSSSQPTACNGREHDCSSSVPGDQDCVYPTGSATFGMCYADWGGGDLVFDLSGNVKEWTATEAAPGVHEIRGGAYSNVEAGRSCTFDFTTGGSTFSFPTTGFRCCRY